MSGNCVGPNRGSSPLSLRRSALNTFSGVIGTSSMRTPTASYTAFATAGGSGSSGPCPHSLAPNGPLGSGSSTTYVTMSHISSVVGLLYSSRLGILMAYRGNRNVVHKIPSLLEYKSPTTLEMCDIVTYVVEDPDPNGPSGAKECGRRPPLPL